MRHLHGCNQRRDTMPCSLSYLVADYCWYYAQNNSQFCEYLPGVMELGFIPDFDTKASRLILLYIFVIHENLDVCLLILLHHIAVYLLRCVKKALS